jgi:predicted small secreted protein
MRPLILFRARGALMAAAVLAATLLAGCNPTYNWRDHASPDGAWKALFPAKPATFTRSVDLDGLQVEMTMTAAEVDGVTFAVGSASAPDGARAQAALPAMRRALLRNIGDDVASAASAASSAAAAQDGLQVDATGSSNGRPVRLQGRFVARGVRVFQVIVLGKPDGAPPEQVEQFLASFTPQ